MLAVNVRGPRVFLLAAAASWRVAAVHLAALTTGPAAVSTSGEEDAETARGGEGATTAEEPRAAETDEKPQKYTIGTPPTSPDENVGVASPTASTATGGGDNSPRAEAEIDECLCPRGLHAMEPRRIGDTPGSGKVYCNHCAFVLKSADPYLQNGDRFYHCPYPECDYDVCADCAKMPALERVGGVHEVHALTGGIEELKSGMYREIASLATGFQEASHDSARRISLNRTGALQLTAEEYAEAQREKWEEQKALREAKKQQALDRQQKDSEAAAGLGMAADENAAGCSSTSAKVKEA